MKTKTLVTTMALTGALLASASVAKANAFLEIITGTSTLTTSVGAGSYSSQLGGSGVTLGGWNIQVQENGNSSGAPFFDVSMNTLDKTGSSPGNGLTVIYSSGLYANYGEYTFSESTTALGNTVGADAEAYRSTAVWGSAGFNTLGTYGTSLGALAVGAGLASSPADVVNGAIGAPQYDLTEVVNIGGGYSASVGKGAVENVTADFSVSAPDGGTTVVMLGSALVGLSFIRSKFGAKRS